MLSRIKSNSIIHAISIFFLYIIINLFYFSDIKQIIFNILFFFVFTCLFLRWAYLKEKELNDLYKDLKKAKENKELLKERLYIAKNHSSVSGLPNRRILKRSLNKELKNIRETKLKGALYLINLDNFKSINDAYGHFYGDMLLKKVGLDLEKNFTEGYKVFHINADEYVVLKTDVEFLGEIVWIAEKIKNMFNRFWKVEDNWYYLNATFGVVVYPDDGEKTSMLLKNLYNALHFAKVKSRGNYELFNVSMNNEIKESKKIEGKIKIALERKEFLVYYQPQIDIKNNCIIGAEALIRWPDGNKDFIPPGKFIPIAEKSGLINAIGSFVLESACKTNKKWMDKGLKPIRVSVNLSPRQFCDSDLLEDIKVILSRSGLSSQWLALEITENTLIKDMDLSIRLLKSLRKMGIKIYLDDFGTGYSSLNYLKRFPIDVLKMDKDFVSGISFDPREEVIAKTIIDLGHGLGIKVEAEGVEKKEQLQFLKDNGCDYVQGFYFSKPIPSEEFEKLLLL